MLAFIASLLMSTLLSRRSAASAISRREHVLLRHLVELEEARGPNVCRPRTASLRVLLARWLPDTETRGRRRLFVQPMCAVEPRPAVCAVAVAADARAPLLVRSAATRARVFPWVLDQGAVGFRGARGGQCAVDAAEAAHAAAHARDAATAAGARVRAERE